MLSCRPLAGLHYSNNIVTLNVVAMPSEFLSPLLEIIASFIVQRGFPEPLEPSPVYATRWPLSTFIMA